MRVSQKIYKITSSMEERVNGFDFGKVLASYYKGHRTGDVELQKKALRWLRGEYKTRTEAKTDLGVNLIISDENWYDFVKLFADFVVKAGYTGLYVCMDELATLYEIPSRVGREYNYNKLLSIYNDALQGKASHLGIIISVTKEAMEDSVRGVFSFGPLKSRLEDTDFAGKGAAGIGVFVSAAELSVQALGEWTAVTRFYTMVRGSAGLKKELDVFTGKPAMPCRRSCL